ncbi:hypothetical protein [Amaricoccus macauensis]|uniref:hypothetical protein n=1 Tax=Amaricoccus macauensis TaxID=57001 RepID=UPI003C7A9CC7
MRLPLLSAASLCAFLAACTTNDGLPEGAPSVRSVPKPGVDAPSARGETRLAVRSFGPDGQEVAGAACAVESTLFTAELVSPARVLMPYYGEASPEITVTCRSGDLSGEVQVAAVSERSSGGAAWPSVGLSVNSDGGVGVGVGLGYYGGRSGASSTAYGYPPAIVRMN